SRIWIARSVRSDSEGSWRGASERIVSSRRLTSRAVTSFMACFRVVLALLKPCSCHSGQEHEVMGEHTEVTLPLARRVGARPQGRPQPPLVPPEGASRLRRLAVPPLGEAPPHLPAIFRLGPLPPGAAAVQRDHRRADQPLLAAEPMVVLGVIGGVGQHPVP